MYVDIITHTHCIFIYATHLSVVINIDGKQLSSAFFFPQRLNLIKQRI